MPKIKLLLRELKRLSSLLSKEIIATKAKEINAENQILKTEEKKEFYHSLRCLELEFLEGIKEKIDSETFGKNE